MPFSNTPVAYGRGNICICQQKGVLIVALHRPRVRNAFSDELYLDLVDILFASKEDNSVSALVLTGCGDYFSSGADLKGQFEIGAHGRQSAYLPAGRFMTSLLRYPKIICAAVNGPAVGIGVTLLMHCDLVFCTDSATFWVPFTRLALVPELCSSTTFVRSMGLSKANELLLLGRKIDAKTAEVWNICSRVVSNADASGDPFAKGSLAMMMANELDKRLLSLPHGQTTSRYFVHLIRGSTRPHMEQVCSEELVKLDERFNLGHVKDAVAKIKIGSKRSKL